MCGGKSCCYSQDCGHVFRPLFLDFQTIYKCSSSFKEIRKYSYGVLRQVGIKESVTFNRLLVPVCVYGHFKDFHNGRHLYIVLTTLLEEISCEYLMHQSIETPTAPIGPGSRIVGEWTLY